MDFENFVMHYLASQEGRFLSPQFSISGSEGGDWSCPDFVSLDISNRQVEIVEVTTSYNVNGIIQKVLNADKHWFDLLRQQLVERRIIDESWLPFVVRLFIREDRCKYAAEKLAAYPNVKIQSIESIAFSWQWPWKTVI